MSSVIHFNVQELISTATARVFATMLSMKARNSMAPNSTCSEAERVVASIGFGGENIAGVLSIDLTSNFAASITASMLSLDPGTPQNPAEVNDVLCELVNVIAGNCLAGLSELGYSCALGLPSVTRGVGFRTQTVRGAKREMHSFECAQHQFFICLDLKSA